LKGTIPLLTKRVFIHLAAVASQKCEVAQNSEKVGITAVQGHPRSSTLVPIKSAHATSYWSLVVTLVVSRTVYEISTH